MTKHSLTHYKMLLKQLTDATSNEEVALARLNLIEFAHEEGAEYKRINDCIQSYKDIVIELNEKIKGLSEINR